MLGILNICERKGDNPGAIMRRFRVVVFFYTTNERIAVFTFISGFGALSLKFMYLVLLCCR